MTLAANTWPRTVASFFLKCGVLAAISLANVCHANVPDMKDQKANIIFLDPQPLNIFSDNQGAISTSVLLKNSGESPGRADFCSLINQATECTKDVEIMPPHGGRQNASLAPGEVRSVLVKIRESKIPISGYLEVLTYDQNDNPTNVGFRQLKVNSALFPPIALLPIALGLVIGVLLCLYSAIQLKNLNPKVTLLDRMGSSNWDFSKSWASNLTVAGAVLSTTLSVAALPELTHHLNKAGYAVLNVLFLLLVALAPFVFNLIRKPIISQTAPDGPTLEFQGFVVAFLIACSVTICAVVGQMTTLIILFDELAFATFAPFVVVRFFQVFIAMLMLGLALYASTTIISTAKSQVIHRQVMLAQAANAKGVPVGSLKDEDSHLPSWSLL